MESIVHAAFKITASGRPTYNINHRHCYGIKQWATILTSIPKTHNLPLQQQLSKAHYATAARGGGGGTRHEKAAAKMRMAPRIAYQPTNASTWIISDGSVSADKEAVNLAKGLSLPWQIKRVHWRKGTCYALPCRNEQDRPVQIVPIELSLELGYLLLALPYSTIRASVAPDSIQEADHGLSPRRKQEAEYVPGCQLLRLGTCGLCNTLY